MFNEMKNSGGNSPHFSSVAIKLEAGCCCTSFSGKGFINFLYRCEGVRKKGSLGVSGSHSALSCEISKVLGKGGLVWLVFAVWVACFERERERRKRASIVWPAHF